MKIILAFESKSVIIVVNQTTMPDPDPIKFISEEPGSHVATNAVRFLSEFSRKVERRVYGQMNIECPNNTAGVFVAYTIFPGGDFYCWFMEFGHLFLVVLVNEKLKTLKVAPVTEGNIFATFVAGVANQLNLKHNYPIEDVDKFTPSTKGIMSDNS